MLWTDLAGRGSGPWWEASRFEGQLNRMLNRFGSSPTGEFPPMNIWADSDQAIVTTEVPGIDPKNIEITVTGKALAIRGAREPEQVSEGDAYHRRERWHGQFSKAIELPFLIEADKVEAKFSRGVLTITLSRAEADKPRKIAIKAN